MIIILLNYAASNTLAPSGIREDPVLELNRKSAEANSIENKIPFPMYAEKESVRILTNQWSDGGSVSIAAHVHEQCFWWQIRNESPPIIVVGAERSLLDRQVIAQADALENRPIIVALIESPSEELMTDCYLQGADRVVITPYCSSKIFESLLLRLLRNDNEYAPYTINASIQTFKVGKRQVRLRKRTFDIARYLFTNNGRLIPKAEMLHDIWGLDSEQCITRRIVVHMSHLRRELVLDGSLGWELRMRRKMGYGIFKTFDNNPNGAQVSERQCA